MPRYFFHVQDGRAIPDTDGTMLPDIDAAREEAVRLSGGLLKDHAKEFWSSQPWLMEVQDQAEALLFTLRFSATDGPVRLAATA
jgi:hypothetical protein